METLSGNTFVANVKNIHPVFGEALTIKVRGLKVDSIETEDSSSASRAFRQWHKFSNLLKEASDIELRNLERGGMVFGYGQMYILMVKFWEIFINQTCRNHFI